MYPLEAKILLTGVAAAAVLPRVPSDLDVGVSARVGDCHSIFGGRLSRSFRQLTVLITVLDWFLALFPSHTVAWIFALRGVIIIFMCFLTPYIFQCYLQDYINIGGRPGKNLMPWLYVSAILTTFGFVVSFQFSSWEWWSLVPIAGALSTWPVRRTLKQYDTVSAPNGRGTMLSQIAATVEHWYAVCMLISAGGEIVTGRGWFNIENEETSASNFWFEARHFHSFAAPVRLFMHALLINVLDEMQHVVRSTTDSPATGSDGRGESASSSSGSASSTHCSTSFEETSIGLIPTTK